MKKNLENSLAPQAFETWTPHMHSCFPMLANLREEWKNKKPLKGVRILHNTPNSKDTIPKVETLLQAGAHVTLTRLKTNRIFGETEATQRMIDMGVSFIADHKDIRDKYDIHMDTGGELLQLPAPRLGSIELTQTGDQLYKRSMRKSISVDNSIMKGLENIFGTGDGFIRAYEQLIGTDIAQEHFLLFGYGRVGQGIVRALRNRTDNLTIVEKLNEFPIHKGDNKYKFLHTTAEEVTAAIKNATVIITATGLKGLISSHYNPQLFKGKCLCNMGAEDEFGDAFSEQEVHSQKRMLNFSIQQPTAEIYLDAIFYAHNLAASLLLKDDNLFDGYNPFPKQEDLRILKEWSNLRKIDISPLLINYPEVTFLENKNINIKERT